MEVEKTENDFAWYWKIETEVMAPQREICSCFWLVGLLALVHGSSS